jgi:ferredoxin--NADP+ reductase
MAGFLGTNFPVLAVEEIGKDLTSYWIEAPDIVRAFGPGQFVIVRLDEGGERIPLTVVDVDRAKGTLRLIVQAVGRTTAQMAELRDGDVILDVFGPLGEAIPIEKSDRAFVIVGGGVGIAPVYPKAKALKEVGNRVLSILGARSSDLLMLEDDMRAVSDELIVCTDDGSHGRMALVTEPLKPRSWKARRERWPRCVAVGPAVMMKFCSAQVCKSYDIGATVLVSLNSIMIDGTGMCGGCRVSDRQRGAVHLRRRPLSSTARQIDWELLIKRAQRLRQTTEARKRRPMDHWENGFAT